MDATLDRFGRIVIPKKLRDELNLGPGSTVRIEEGKDGILLKPVEGEGNLKEKNGVLVFTGKTNGDIESRLDEVRQVRNSLLGGIE